MSVFDLPRVHFAGTAVTRLPTGPRSGYVDLATNQAMTDDGFWPPEWPAQQYHRWLTNRGCRYAADGEIRSDGLFSSTAGWNLGGNGHFWIDAQIVGCETVTGRLELSDPAVGRSVDLWGHHNDYLSTTANRARVFDVDPASVWTTSLMVGRLALGRSGRSHEGGYMLSGDVTDICAPRRRHGRHVLADDGLPFAAFRHQSVLYQFTVDAGDGLQWFDTVEVSPSVSALRMLLDRGQAQGLTVQLALCDMAAPRANDAPDHWRLRGTVAPWYDHEMRTGPGGRLLTGRAAGTGPGRVVHDLSLRVLRDHVVVNAVDAFSYAHSSWSSEPTHEDGSTPWASAGELRLRTASGRILASLPPELYAARSNDATSGILTVERADGSTDDPTEGLWLEGPDGRAVLIEEEVAIYADTAVHILDHPAHRDAPDQTGVVEVFSFVCGRAAAVDAVAIQLHNPAGLPGDNDASAKQARTGDLEIVAMTTAPGDPHITEGHPIGMFTTDACGRARLGIRGVRAGVTRVLVRPQDIPTPWDPCSPGSAWVAADVNDDLGYWSSAAAAAVRVLPNHQHLDDIPDGEVTFDVLYREVYAYYEQVYPFMATEIMSLADEAMVTNYARLIWLMCDPAAKGRTWYMPSTREMSAPQTNLLRRFLANVAATRPIRAVPAGTPARPVPIRTRDELDAALRQAATIELAVMLQYLYAMWSLPTHRAGSAMVRQGRWTEEQCAFVCGRGPASTDGGIRGTLFEVAREEMIHFLVINNIIMATGQPFHVPAIDFTSLNADIDLPMDLCLERFSLSSLSKFVELEKPFSLTTEHLRTAPGDPQREGARYGSLSELYASIRDGLARLPEVFLIRRGQGGGEHHLFMRRSTDLTHPDYQLEVDDLSSALFAIDFVTEHGEGGVISAPVGGGEESHFETFLRLTETMKQQYVPGPGGRAVPWEPALPVVRNPTLWSAHGNGDPVTQPEARSAMTLFNRAYALMLRLMAQHFGAAPDLSLRRSTLMNASIDVMTGVLRPLAELIVTLPSGRPGRTAGPSFELRGAVTPLPRADAARLWFVREFRELAEAVRAVAHLPVEVGGVLDSHTARLGGTPALDSGAPQ